MATKLAEAFVEITEKGCDEAIKKIEDVKKALESMHQTAQEHGQVEVGGEGGGGGLFGKIFGGLASGITGMFGGIVHTITHSIGSIAEMIAEPLKEVMHGIFEGIGIGGGLTIFEFVKDKLHEAFTAFSRDEVAMAQITAAVKSTGQAAGWTAEQLEKMADKIGNNTIFSKVQELQGLRALLSFRNIGGETLEETLKVVNDIASVTGDLESVAFRVGRALQSPADSMYLLTRMGVRFNEEEQRTIQLMQQTGDIAGAQKMILDRLKESWGGTADEMSGTWTGVFAKLSSNVEELMAKIGGLFGGKEIVNSVSEWVGELVAHFDELWERITEGARGIIEYWKKLFDQIAEYIGAPVKEGIDSALNTFTSLVTHLDGVWGVIKSAAKLAFMEIKDYAWTFGQQLMAIFSAVGTGISATLAAIGQSQLPNFTRWTAQYQEWAEYTRNKTAAETHLYELEQAKKNSEDPGSLDKRIARISQRLQELAAADPNLGDATGANAREKARLEDELWGLKKRREKVTPEEIEARAWLDKAIEQEKGRIKGIDEDYKKRSEAAQNEIDNPRALEKGIEAAKNAIAEGLRKIPGYEPSEDVKKQSEELGKRLEDLKNAIASDRDRKWNDGEKPEKPGPQAPLENLSRHHGDAERFNIEELSRNIQAGAVRGKQEQIDNIAKGIQAAGPINVAPQPAIAGGGKGP